jgi:cytoskeletal protein CcmA (bactofilin family)
MVLIGRMEEAEALQQWADQTTRFHLCGEECLYRKLSSIFMHGIHDPVNGVNGRHLSPPFSAQTTASSADSKAKPPVSESRNGSGDSSWLRLSTRGAVRRILGLGNHMQPTAHSSASSALNTAPKMNQKVPSTRLREAAEVAESLRITGRILSREPLHVNGEVAGTLELPGDRLTVGPSGNIRAAVSAKEVEIFGFIEGEVTADRVIVRRNATLIGDVCAQALVIEGGACFQGNSSMGSRRTAANAITVSEARTGRAF